jgi:hypothetical protein
MTIIVTDRRASWIAAGLSSRSNVEQKNTNLPIVGDSLSGASSSRVIAGRGRSNLFQILIYCVEDIFIAPRWFLCTVMLHHIQYWPLARVSLEKIHRNVQEEKVMKRRASFSYTTCVSIYIIIRRVNHVISCYRGTAPILDFHMKVFFADHYNSVNAIGYPEGSSQYRFIIGHCMINDYTNSGSGNQPARNT